MTTFCQENNVLIIGRGHETIRVEPWGTNSLRVRATVNRSFNDESLSTLLSPTKSEAKIIINASNATITNGCITAEVQTRGNLRFIETDSGAELLAECPPHYAYTSTHDFQAIDGDLHRVAVRFKAYDGERFYGLGQHQHGRLDQKGCVIDLIQTNSEVNIPFLVSNRGYGLLWNNPGIGRVELGATGTRWVAEGTHQIDYWITAGSTPTTIMAHYANATGHVPMLPEWAAGFWQCKLRYTSQDEVLNIAREYKRRGLPISVIVVDYFHWTCQGDWKFDPVDWPDPSGMVRELAEIGVQVMVSIWPTVNAHSDNFAALEEQGLLIRTRRGVGAHMAFVDTHSEGRVYLHYYDATHPRARDFIWNRVREGYYQHGIKVWWLDACEPETLPTHPDHLHYYLGSGLAVANLYPLMNARAFYEGMQTEGETEIITLNRSAWAGSQRYAAAVWSGDIASTFEALSNQIRAGLNIGLSGIPWWTTDIGGFMGGNTEDPVFRELIVRWFQYGVFCPLFRLHGHRLPAPSPKSGGPNEVWSFGDEAYVIIQQQLFLRERLRPYIMDQMRAAHEHGAPIIRPLFFDFPADEMSWMVEDQFMFGPDILVAPVTEYGMRHRNVYLPAEVEWINAQSGEDYTGGQTIKAAAPLEHIPVFLRRGCCLLNVIKNKT